MKDKNIFDLLDLSDVPKKLLTDLSVVNSGDFENKIIEVFRRAKRELMLDEVTVGYYRLHNEEKERRQIMAKLYHMSRSDSPAIQSMKGKKGVYKLMEEMNSP